MPTQPHAYAIGVDVGQKHDPTAISVVAHIHRAKLPVFVREDDAHARDLYQTALAMRERGELPVAGGVETVFEARLLYRLRLGIPYPDMAAAVADVARSVAQQTPLVPRLYLDATGVGTAFLDLLRAEFPPCQITPVYFTHGDRLLWRREGQRPALHRRDMRPWVLSLGKAWLVTRLQALFEGQRVKLSPRSADAAAMRQELLDYQIKQTAVNNEQYGAFSVGAHDDLVTALGLATLIETSPPAERPERRGAAIVPGVL